MTAATCPATLGPGGLTCTRPTHDGRGHVYVATSGSNVDDRHTDGGHG